MVIEKCLDGGENPSDARHRLPRIGELPAHQHHQIESEKQKDEAADPVLNADHLVIGGENVSAPPTELVMLVIGVVVVGIVMGFDGSGSVHFEKKLPCQYRKRNAHCKAQKSS